MSSVFISLTAIVLVATIAPVISFLVPRNLLPESVLLVVGGIIIGPAVLGIGHMGHEIELLRELGLGFLFLLAGFEVDVHGLKGRSGRLASGAWMISALLALLVTVFMPGVTVFSAEGFAVAIAMTATALGALLPILRDRNMLESKIGKAIINHGTMGELFPILAMAILLGVRNTVVNAVVVIIFLAIAIVIGLIPRKAQAVGNRLIDIIHFGAESTAQTTVRLTVLLLVILITVATIFKLDVVLGAFAAGFIVRQALPKGRRELEEKLDGIGYGFLIPIFFVTTGMSLELDGVIQNPWFALIFVGLLMVVRGTPVFLAAFLELDSAPLTRFRQALRIATYSSTSLPMIVAVTHVAVSSGVMEPATASTLVIGGAASVLIMPLLGSLLDSHKDMEKSDDTKVRSAEQKAHEAKEAMESTRKIMREAAVAQLEASSVDPDTLDEETRETALKRREELADMVKHAQVVTEALALKASQVFPGSDWEAIAQRLNLERRAVIEQLFHHLQDDVDLHETWKTLSEDEDEMVISSDLVIRYLDRLQPPESGSEVCAIEDGDAAQVPESPQSQPTAE